MFYKFIFGMLGLELLLFYVVDELDFDKPGLLVC